MDQQSFPAYRLLKDIEIGHGISAIPAGLIFHLGYNGEPKFMLFGELKDESWFEAHPHMFEKIPTIEIK